MGTPRSCVFYLAHVGIRVSLVRMAGISALVRAAADNQLDVVMALVQARASINEQQQTGGFVPLHAAVNRGHLEVARYLCTSRANVACYADHGLTPLSNAAWAGHDEIVQFLQERLALVP